VNNYFFCGLSFRPADGKLIHRTTQQSVSLRPQVAKCLTVFLQHPATLVSREVLVDAIWGEKTVVDFESGLAAILKELRAELMALGQRSDLIETIPRRGYRLNADVSGSASKRAWSVRIFAVLLALVLVSAGLYWVLGQKNHESAAALPEIMTLAILPFEQFGELDSARPSLLLADRLLMAIWERKPESVVLLGRISTASLSTNDEKRVAAAGQLAADLLLEGSVTVEQGQVSVTARLVTMPAAAVVWAETAVLEGSADAESFDRLAEQLADSLDARWRSQVP
jgi:DNA-binding winged helix-turn-helix (wHTH) protein/TolB-like protein